MACEVPSDHRLAPPAAPTPARPLAAAVAELQRRAGRRGLEVLEVKLVVELVRAATYGAWKPTRSH